MFPNGRSAILLALVTCVVGRLSPSPKVDATAASPNIVPNQYIVETSDHSVLARLGNKGNQRRSFYDQHQKRDIHFTVSKEFNVSNIFVGGVLEFANKENVSALSKIDGVVSVKPVRRYPALKPASLATLTDTDNSTTPDTFSTHVMTGVDKVHAQGFTGKGIKIGIIDSGIDYTNTALGGGFGPGFKVAGGYDFVGDNYDGRNTPVPDSDPLDQCNGFGTLIAGIIGANPGNDRNISGVAYDATLYAYRIFGCNGGSSTTLVIDALLRGYQEKMDILTVSLGEPDVGFSEDPAGVVASRIAKSGTVVTMPTGNDGSRGPWYALAPGTGKDVISVGSVDNVVLEGLLNTDTGGIMSSFSSLGPTYELDFKPAISAPGREIVSTLPRNTFGIGTGTTMAAPFVAGSAALVLQARGNTKEVSLAMRDILESAALPIASNLTHEKPPQTLIWAGAGLIKVDRAVNTKTLVNPGYLTLNDTAHFRPIQTFTITNHGTDPLAYVLTHVPAGTIYTYAGLEPVLPPFTLTTDSATVKFSQSTLSLKPGQSSTITATFTPPAIDPKGYPAYSGHIVITSLSEIVRVSYLGVLGSVQEQQLLDHSDVPFNSPLPLIQLPDGSVQNTTANYTFAKGDQPTLVSRLLFGSPELRVDLVTADSKEGSSPKVLGNLVSNDFNPRTSVGEFLNITLTGTFGNGTTIPDGEYRLYLKALKIFGKPSEQKDWETYLSPIVVKNSTTALNQTATPS